MGLLRGRGLNGTRYTMREKLFSIGDDFWIENDSGEKAFKVNGKALRIRDKMAVERNGQTVATIKKALITPLRERYSVKVEKGASRRRATSSTTSTSQARRRQDRGGVEALVPDARHVWHRGRTRPGRRAHPRVHGLHRPDEPAGLSSADV
jgi:hypothetical protein